MNVIKEIERINKLELQNGSVNTPASWHTKYANSAWVYIGNLPIRLTEGDILAVMSQWGEIEDINLVRDDSSGSTDAGSSTKDDKKSNTSDANTDDNANKGGTGKSRGFCFLKYEDARSCVLAVDNFNGTKIVGRSIRVDHVENYRLPKHLREKEEEDDGAHDEDDHLNSMQPGHAYKDKEFANSFTISQGHDLFDPDAALGNPPSAPGAGNSNNDEVDNRKQSKIERREAKQKRKEERDQKRRDKQIRKERREEKRREHRARRVAHEEEKKIRRKRRKRQDDDGSDDERRRRKRMGESKREDDSDDGSRSLSCASSQ